MEKFIILTTVTSTIIALLLLAVSTEATSCAEERIDWHPLYFTQMFRQRGIQGLIKGRVIQVFPPQHVPHLGHDVITAQMDLECVYRGGSGLKASALLNVTGFGHGRDCVETNVVAGEVYLMFVEPFSHPSIYAHYAVQEFNMQKGAFVASQLKLAMVTSVYECRRPTGVVTTTLSPWQSLTPIMQLPWIINPEDTSQARGSGLMISPSLYLLLLSFAIAVKILTRC